MQGQQSGQQGFNANRAVSGLREWLPLGFLILWIMAGDDDINRAVCDTGNQCQSVFFAAQRRR